MQLIQVNAEQTGSSPYALFAQIVQSACSQEAAVSEHLPAAVRDSVMAGREDLATQLATLTAAEHAQCWRALCTSRSAVVLIDDLARADVPSIQACLRLSDLAKSWPPKMLDRINAL